MTDTKTRTRTITLSNRPPGTTVHLLNTPDSYADGTTDNVAVHHYSEDDKTTDEAIQAEVERLLGFEVASVKFVDAGDHPTEIESIYRVTLIGAEAR